LYQYCFSKGITDAGKTTSKEGGEVSKGGREGKKEARKEGGKNGKTKGRKEGGEKEKVKGE